MAYKDKADKYLQKQIDETLNTDPLSMTMRKEYVTDGSRWVDPSTGNQLSDTEASQRFADKKKSPKPKLDMDPIDIGGEYVKYGEPMPNLQFDPLTVTAQEMRREPAERSYSSDRAMLADLVAAALPTVSGLLNKSSNNVMMNHFDRQNRYTDIRGKQINPSKENMVVLQDEEGNPYYELANNSLGEKPYYKPQLLRGANTTASSSQGGGVHSVQRAFDPNTGEPVFVTYYKDGSTSISKDLQPFGGYGTFTAETPYGDKYQNQYIRNAPTNTRKQTNYQSGYGSMVGKEGERGVPLDTMKLADKNIENYKKDISDVVQKREDLRARLDVINYNKPTPQDLAGLQNALLFANTIESKLTDEDAKRAMGETMKAYSAQLSSFLSRKALGQLSDQDSSNMKKSAENLIGVMDKIEQFYRSGLNKTMQQVPGGRRYLETRDLGPQTESTQSANIAKQKAMQVTGAELKEIEAVAGKYFKKGTDQYNNFVEKMRMEYGKNK